LSLVTLAGLGAADALSVVIRFSIVQIETPDEKRAVSAHHYLLVGSSNTLGEFESGWSPRGSAGSLGPHRRHRFADGRRGLDGFLPGLRKIDRFEPADIKKDV